MHVHIYIHIGSQLSQHSHQYATTLMSPNKGEAQQSLFGMTGEAITGSWSIGWSDHPQATQHYSSSAVCGLGVGLPVIIIYSSHGTHITVRNDILPTATAIIYMYIQGSNFDHSLIYAIKKEKLKIAHCCMFLCTQYNTQ